MLLSDSMAEYDRPPGWLIFGNIFDIGTIPHRTIYELRFKYGAVLRLRQGSRDTVVIQSAKAVEELFKNHDATFCDRASLDVFTSHNYQEASLALEVSPYWLMLRRLCSMELMTNKRINETASIRRECVDQMLRSIEDDMAAAKARGESGELNLPHYTFLMLFTLVDFLPFLKWSDSQGLKSNMLRDMGRILEIVAGFVKERIEEHKLGKEKANDFLDVLLEYEGDGKEWHEKINYEKVIIIIMEIFLQGLKLQVQQWNSLWQGYFAILIP
ncbi:hypothetical protein GH714_038645 [Hevea brasiliensis]|uniref:Cytochrome P450 n=1 Tax=Hevea brasiliensis TaxID=3981 RepID=A0A6A6KLI2_HEVBR|nr:hypothetical protein GH714_038645 [Hevea brasiliensis]